MSLFDCFKKKTPEEKAAAHLEKMRKNEGDRGFAAAAMTPVGDIEVGDISIVRLCPEEKEMLISCQLKKVHVPYTALRSVVVSSEIEIAEGKSPITLAEMEALLEGRAGLFVGAMETTASFHARWFARFTCEDKYGVDRDLYFILFSMAGPYMATNKLHAATLFEENFADILERCRHEIPARETYPDLSATLKPEEEAAKAAAEKAEQAEQEAGGEASPAAENETPKTE